MLTGSNWQKMAGIFSYTNRNIFIMELKYVNVNVSSHDDSDPEVLIVK